MSATTMGPGRPPVGPGFKVRLFPAQRSALAYCASLIGTTPSELIRQAIDREVARIQQSTEVEA